MSSEASFASTSSSLTFLGRSSSAMRGAAIVRGTAAGNDGVVRRPLERPADRDYGAGQANLQGKGASMSRSKTILALTIVLLVVWSNTALGSNGDPLRLGQANGATEGTTLTVK